MVEKQQRQEGEGRAVVKPPGPSCKVTNQFFRDQGGNSNAQAPPSKAQEPYSDSYPEVSGYQMGTTTQGFLLPLMEKEAAAT